MVKAKLKYPDKGWYTIQCPACKTEHVIAVDTSLHPDLNVRWGFNDDVLCPSFTPSVKITWGKHPGKPDVCHFFITHGKIRYCNDCTHELAGKVVDLPIYQEESPNAS